MVFGATICACVAPLGGTKRNTASLKPGFRFQAISDTDCGRASSLRLVITTLRGSGLAYLNRLSDLLFVAARLIGLRTQVKEVLWQAAPKPKA